MTKQIGIGGHFYLWTPDSGLTDTVVISCHGGMLPNSWTPPRGSVFKFFSLPTQSAYGALEKTIYDDQIKETKDCSDARDAWRQMDDYTLSKFQGKHGGDSESYADIKSAISY